MSNLTTNPVQIGIVAIIAGALFLALMRLMLYLNSRRIRTHPSQKKSSEANSRKTRSERGES